jgi:hypothetical protein
LTFESGSHLSILGQSAFSGSSLQSICIPSSIERLPRSSLDGCRSLVRIDFESGCRLSDEALSELRSKYKVMTSPLTAGLKLSGRSSQIERWSYKSVFRFTFF